MGHSHSRKLSTHDSEQATNTCKNMDESHKHNFEEKKADTSEYIHQVQQLDKVIYVLRVARVVTF